MARARQIANATLERDQGGKISIPTNSRIDSQLTKEQMKSLDKLQRMLALRQQALTTEALYDECILELLDDSPPMSDMEARLLTGGRNRDGDVTALAHAVAQNASAVLRAGTRLVPPANVEHSSHLGANNARRGPAPAGDNAGPARREMAKQRHDGSGNRPATVPPAAPTRVAAPAEPMSVKHVTGPETPRRAATFDHEMCGQGRETAKQNETQGLLATSAEGDDAHADNHTEYDHDHVHDSSQSGQDQTAAKINLESAATVSPPPTAALSKRDSHHQDALPSLLRPGGSNFHEAKTVPAERSAGFLEFSNFPKPDKEVEEVDGHEGAIVTAAPLSDYMETTNPSQCPMHVGELLINSPDAERRPTDSNSDDDDVENSKPDPNPDITLVEAT